jgi:hypothetical protein
MKNWLLCGHSNPRNLGDKLTDPRLYFNALKGFDWADIDDLPGVDLAKYAGVIFGAGGMLYGESESRMKSVVNSGKPTIVFGAGLNYPDDDMPPRYPEWLKDCVYVALRDYGSPYDWCPCPSCLHPAFYYRSVSHHRTVTYGHHLEPKEIHLSPAKDLSEVGAVLHHIGMAGSVETDSYHGAYWATLLGRPLKIINPRSSIKFRLLGDSGLNHSQTLVHSCYAKLLKHL